MVTGPHKGYVMILLVLPQRHLLYLFLAGALPIDCHIQPNISVVHIQR
jgi:hypothetical protein